MSKWKPILAIGALFAIVAASLLLRRLDEAAMKTNTEPIAPDVEAGEQQVVLEDLGMFCSICEATVYHRLSDLAGVSSFTINLPDDSVSVVYDPDAVQVEDIVQTLADVGFQPGQIMESQHDADHN